MTGKEVQERLKRCEGCEYCKSMSVDQWATTPGCFYTKPHSGVWAVNVKDCPKPVETNPLDIEEYIEEEEEPEIDTLNNLLYDLLAKIRDEIDDFLKQLS